MVFVIGKDYVTKGSECVALAVARTTQLLTLRDQQNSVLFLRQVLCPVVLQILNVKCPRAHVNEDDIYDSLLARYNELQSVRVVVGGLDQRSPHDFTQTRTEHDANSIHLNAEWLVAEFKSQELSENSEDYSNIHLTMLVLKLICGYANFLTDHVFAYISQQVSEPVAALKADINIGHCVEKWIIGGRLHFITDVFSPFTPTHLAFSDRKGKSGQFVFKQSSQLVRWMEVVTTAPLTCDSDLASMFHPDGRYLKRVAGSDDTAAITLPKNNSTGKPSKRARPASHKQQAATTRKKAKTAAYIDAHFDSDDENYSWLRIPTVPARKGWKS